MGRFSSGKLLFLRNLMIYKNGSYFAKEILLQ